MELAQLCREINDRGIFRAPPGFMLRGIPDGKAYAWQFYLRNIITDPVCLRVIAAELSKLAPLGHQLAGMESAGPPIVSAIMMNDRVHDGYFFIRKELKKYGLMNAIEGVYDARKPVTLVDDISNSKNTLMMARHQCERHGMSVTGAVTIVNKQCLAVDTASNLNVQSLFTLDDFDLCWQEYYERVPAHVERLARAHALQTYKHVLWHEYSPGKLMPCSSIVGFDKYVQHLFGKQDENKVNIRMVS